MRVGASEVGIVGLEAALRDVYFSDIKDEDQVKARLLQKVKEFGNYIAPGTEAVYEDALLREYKNYLESMLPKASKS